MSRAYDFNFYGLWEMRQMSWAKGQARFGLGGGVNVRARFVHDVRSSARSSAEPFFAISLSSSIGKNMRISLPVWFTFYTDGLSVNLLPEWEKSWRKWGLFFRVEFPQYLRYTPFQHEGILDAYVGIRWKIGSN